MPLSSVIHASFERSFALCHDLVDAIDNGVLVARLPGLPSNTVGLQVWCVVGARESYAQALKAGQWAGFACSLASVAEKGAVAAALRSSANPHIASRQVKKDQRSRSIRSKLWEFKAHNPEDFADDRL